MNEFTIYTDGSSKGNPGPSGWAFLILKGKNNIHASMGGGFEHKTNNYAELFAIYSSLKYIQENFDLSAGVGFIIKSDSQYSINSISKNYLNNRKNNFQRSGSDIPNAEILRMVADIEHVLEFVTFEWVKGHSGEIWNEMVDKTAFSHADEYSRRAKGDFQDNDEDLIIEHQEVDEPISEIINPSLDKSNSPEVREDDLEFNLKESFGDLSAEDVYDSNQEDLLIEVTAQNEDNDSSIQPEPNNTETEGCGVDSNVINHNPESISSFQENIVGEAQNNFYVYNRNDTLLEGAKISFVYLDEEYNGIVRGRRGDFYSIEVCEAIRGNFYSNLIIHKDEIKIIIT